MMTSRTSLFLFAAVFLCAFMVEEATSKRPLKDFLNRHTDDKSPANAESSQKWSPFEPYTKPQGAAPANSSENSVPGGDQTFLWNPLKFVLRLIAIVTYPPRFIIRFFYTFAAVFFLVLFNCQVIPEVQCVAPVSDMIPGIMDGLREELNFYASLGKQGT